MIMGQAFTKGSISFLEIFMLLNSYSVFKTKFYLKFYIFIL